ncbi:hypothetical protein [Bradyrhizobium tunisiense]|uniref:hypothetical protein n=1 Tax=Bradyrhizobium tunisiense TaxID=3278709 RepID=UPI0035DB6428
MDATKKLEAKGRPVDFQQLLRMSSMAARPTSGSESAHWKRWLDPQTCCLVPFTSFSEEDTIDGKKVSVRFAPDESRPVLDDGVAAGKTECISANVAVRRAEALSRKPGVMGAVAFSGTEGPIARRLRRRQGDPHMRRRTRRSEHADRPDVATPRRWHQSGIRLRTRI